MKAPYPRWATRDEWSVWLAALSWEEHLSRGDDDPPHEYTVAEADVHERRRVLRESQERFSDPFSHGDERIGPWPRVDSIGAPVFSNTWRADHSGGWTAAGFPWNGHRRVAHRELCEELIPRRCKTPSTRVTWLTDAIAAQRADSQRSLRLVLAERHGRLRGPAPSAMRLAMAWNHLAANRASFQALSNLLQEARREADSAESQLNLFPP